MNNNEQSNPYQAPEAPIHEPSATRDRELVSGWRRLGTYLIDVIGFYIVFLLFVMLATLLFGQSWLNMLEGIGGNLIGIGFFIAYYIGFEAAFSRTPGKFLLGTIVVDEDGKKPGIGQFIGRSFARLIPFEAFSCIGGQSRGWHDSLSKTYVVKAG